MGETDTISRQAALDAIMGQPPEPHYPSWYAAQIEKLPAAQPEQRWIPVTERLPEHGGRYLVSVLDGINRRTTVAPYMPRCKAWTMTGRMTYWKVIAWMPLPASYKGE